MRCGALHGLGRMREVDTGLGSVEGMTYPEMIMPASKKYDQETRGRAVRVYAARMTEGGISQLKVRQEVGELLGINPTTLRNWIRRDQGEGATPAAGEPRDDEVLRPQREVAQLERANEILRTASAFFAAAELDRKIGL